MFLDMVHSKHAARIRLWIKLKGPSDIIDSMMIAYAGLLSDEHKIVNPLEKGTIFRYQKIQVWMGNCCMGELRGESLAEPMEPTRPSSATSVAFCPRGLKIAAEGAQRPPR